MLKIGHRGAAGHAPENTLQSFAKALELGANGVEFDVHICKSGEPVVIHDETLERTTNGTGFVKEKTLTELKTLDAGKGEKIPTLTEALDFIDKRVLVMVELKSTDSPGPVADMLQYHVNDRGWEYSQFIVVSFNHHWLAQIRAINPQIAVGATLVGIPLDYARLAADIGAAAINPSIDYVNEDFVTDAHARGLDVYVWTVNAPYKIARAKNLGVDGIISDHPDRL